MTIWKDMGWHTVEINYRKYHFTSEAEARSFAKFWNVEFKAKA